MAVRRVVWRSNIFLCFTVVCAFVFFQSNDKKTLFISSICEINGGLFAGSLDTNNSAVNGVNVYGLYISSTKPQSNCETERTAVTYKLRSWKEVYIENFEDYGSEDTYLYILRENLITKCSLSLVFNDANLCLEFACIVREPFGFGSTSLYVRRYAKRTGRPCLYYSNSVATFQVLLSSGDSN